MWEAVDGNAGVSRRSVVTVKKQSSEAELISEARKHGFHVALIGDQYFVFKDPIVVKC